MRACSAQVRDGEIQVWEWVRWLECSVGSEQKNRLREQRVNLNLFIAATTEPKKKTPTFGVKAAELAHTAKRL